MEMEKGGEKERGKEQRDETSMRTGIVGQSRLSEILKKGLLWHITLLLHAPKILHKNLYDSSVLLDICILLFLGWLVCFLMSDSPRWDFPEGESQD